MRFCQAKFYQIQPEQVYSVLSSFTQESFVRGQEAYLLNDGTYAVDAGENDIRALYDRDNESIKFMCRYEQDLEFYEKKLLAFAAKHKISLSADEL